MSRYEELQGKVAIVTGAGRGIGRAISLRLAREGVAVVVTDVDTKAAEETSHEIGSKGGHSIALKVDVIRQGDIDQMIAKCVSEFGAPNIFVHNAGVGAVGRLIDTDEQTWDWVMDVNAKGTFLCTKAAALQMIKQRA